MKSSNLTQGDKRLLLSQEDSTLLNQQKQGGTSTIFCTIVIIAPNLVVVWITLSWGACPLNLPTITRKLWSFGKSICNLFQLIYLPLPICNLIVHIAYLPFKGVGGTGLSPALHIDIIISQEDGVPSISVYYLRPDNAPRVSSVQCAFTTLAYLNYDIPIFCQARYHN